MRKLTLKEAEKMVDAAMEHCKKIGWEASIAVVDEGGYVVALKRMDGAMVITADIAVKKAFTGATFRFRTETLKAIMEPGEMAFQLNTLDPRYCIVKGGIPVKEGDDVLGGIGCSGAGSADLDNEVCEAGLKATGFTTEIKNKYADYFAKLQK